MRLTHGGCRQGDRRLNARLPNCSNRFSKSEEHFWRQNPYQWVVIVCKQSESSTYLEGRHGTRHNDTQYNDIQPIGN